MTGVVQIAHHDYGIEAFQAFVDSYRRHDSGTVHDLVIALKGFANPEEARPFLDLLQGIDFKALFVPNTGFDIGTYLHVVRNTEYRYYCFLNSRSTILADGWLASLKRHAEEPGIGVVGATGSYESLYTGHIESCRHRMDGPLWRRLIRRSRLNAWRHRLRYPPFPNPHLRTNAFMIRRDVLLRVRVGRIKTRRDTSLFENGKRNITRQIQRMGLRVAIVGRDGEAYDVAQWPNSGTFWQENQDNLIVADNQTSNYAHATAIQRVELNRKAWGSA